MIIQSENIVLASSQTHSYFDPPTLLSFIKQTEWFNRHHPGLWIPHPLLTDMTLHHSLPPSTAATLNNNNNCIDAIYLNNTLCLATAAGAARDLIAISSLNFNHHDQLHEASTLPPLSSSSSSSSFPRSFAQVTGPLSQLTFNYSSSSSSPTINPTLAARSNHNLSFYKLSPTMMPSSDPNHHHQKPPPSTSASSSLLPSSSFTLQPIASLSDLPLTSDLAWNRRLTDRSVLVCSDGTLMEVVLQPQGGCRCTTTTLIINNNPTSSGNSHPLSSRLRCMFYPHPRVVAVSSSRSVYRVDLREGQGRGTQMRQLFSLSPSSSSSSSSRGGGEGEEIQALAVPESLVHRNTDDDHECIDENILGVATQRRVLLYDLRNPALPLVSWEHRLVHGDRMSAGASCSTSSGDGIGTRGGVNHLCFVPCSETDNNTEEESNSSSGCLLVSGSSSRNSNSGGGGTMACKFKIRKKEKHGLSSSSSEVAVWSASSSRSYYTRSTPESDVEREEMKKELRYSWLPGKKKDGQYEADTVPPRVVLDTLGSQSLHSLHTAMRSLSLQQQRQDVEERGEAVAGTVGGGVPSSSSSSSSSSTTLRSIVTAIPKDVDTFFSLLQQQQQQDSKKKKKKNSGANTTTARLLLDTGKKQEDNNRMNRDPSLSGYPLTTNDVGIAVVVSDWVTRRALSWDGNNSGGGEDEEEEMMQPGTSTAAPAAAPRRVQRSTNSSMPPVIVARLMAYGDIALSEISGAIVGGKEGGGRGEMVPSSIGNDGNGWRVLCPREEEDVPMTAMPPNGPKPIIEEGQLQGRGGGGGERLTKGIPAETELVLQPRRDRHSVEMPLHLLLFQESLNNNNNGGGGGGGVRLHLRELLETVVAKGSPVMVTVDEIKRGLEVKLVEDEQTRLEGRGGGFFNHNILPMVAVPALKAADMHRQKNEMMANCRKSQTSLKNALAALKCVVLVMRSGPSSDAAAEDTVVLELAGGTDSDGNNNPTSLKGMMNMMIRGEREEEQEGEEEKEETQEEEEFKLLLKDVCRDMGGGVDFDSQHGLVTICGGYQKN